MSGLLYTNGPNALPVFLFVTIALGGAAALTTGGAIARRWRTAAQIPLAMAALAFVVCFLHYALFNEPTIPLRALTATFLQIRDNPAGAAREMAETLHYLFVTFVILTGFAAAGFRWTRRRQMARQYHWLAEPSHDPGSPADSG